PGVRLSGVLRATLPGGSITGAPKRAALGFIRRLEPCARGPYTGAAGFVRGDGRAVFNVAIRTAIVSDAGVEYHAGGGIVWDSDPRAEWEETETKSRELFAVLARRERPQNRVMPDLFAPIPWDAPAVERGIGFFETALVIGRRAVLWRPHL